MAGIEFYRNQRVGNLFININIVFCDDNPHHKYVSCYIWEINRRDENGERLDDIVVDSKVSRRGVLNDCLFQIHRHLESKGLSISTDWQIRSYGNYATRDCFESLIVELNNG